MRYAPRLLTLPKLDRQSEAFGTGLSGLVVPPRPRAVAVTELFSGSGLASADSLHSSTVRDATKAPGRERGLWGRNVVATYLNNSLTKQVGWFLYADDVLVSGGVG